MSEHSAQGVVMVRAATAVLLAGALVLVSVAPSAAFDGHRKGFILGFGIGPSLTSLSEDLEIGGVDYGRSDVEYRAGVATDFRIGFGATDRLLIYYDNKVSWSSFTEVDGRGTLR